MSNWKAWYRKYRPSTFDGYLGEDIKRVVEARMTEENGRPSVILLHGTRGCGKTTFARIVSKYYQCEDFRDGAPCEECEACISINAALIDGDSAEECPGVTEIDATTSNGKDAITQIVEDALIPPIYTKKKIIIFDECHKITSSAQNALLKVIEDIPEHLVVIFATTEADKVLQTIKSRCQLKIEVRKQSVKDMADRLMYICEQEGLAVQKEALKIIAKKADRVPRECINMLESIAKANKGKVTVANVREMTNDIAYEQYMDFFVRANGTLEGILQFIRKLKEDGIPASEYMSGMTRFVLDCMYARHGIALEEHTPEFVKAARKLFEMYDSSKFDVLLQSIEYTNRGISDDDYRNDMLLLMLSFKIGKIDILAKGLTERKQEAEAENAAGNKIYSSEFQDATSKITASTTSVDIEALNNVVSGFKVVRGTPFQEVALDAKDDTEDTEDTEDTDDTEEDEGAKELNPEPIESEEESAKESTEALLKRMLGR